MAVTGQQDIVLLPHLHRILLSDMYLSIRAECAEVQSLTSDCPVSLLSLLGADIALNLFNGSMHSTHALPFVMHIYLHLRKSLSPCLPSKCLSFIQVY